MSKQKRTVPGPGNSLVGRRGLWGFFSAHRIAIGLFAILLLYGLVVVKRCSLPKVEGLCYSFHAVDFDFGFCSKFLPGAVYNLFVNSPSPESATVYESVLLLVLYIAVSLLLERLILSIPEQYQPVVFLLLAFYLTGPATFAPYIYSLGMLDVYWLFLTVPFLLMLQNRYACMALPLLFVPSVMIHFGAMLTYVPFFALLILYEATCSERKRDRRKLVAVFAAGIVLASGTFFYFCSNEKNNVTVEIEEFNQIMASRGVEDAFYFDYALYGSGQIDDDRLLASADKAEFYPEAPGKVLFPNDDNNPVLRLINTVAYQAQVHFYLYTHHPIVKRTFLQFVMLVVVLLPVFLFFLRLFVLRFRQKERSHLSCFVQFCLLAYFPLAIMVSLLISTDSTRWTYHLFTILFTFVLYMAYKEKNAVLDQIDQSLDKTPRHFIGIYFVIYFFTSLKAYV